ENCLRNGSAISATRILNKVIKLDPKNPRAQMNLGELLTREGKMEQAHGCFIEAGAAFWHKGNIQAAIRMNERALTTIPGSRQAMVALALLQQELEEPEAAHRQQPQPKQSIVSSQTQNVITSELPPIMIDIPDELAKTEPAAVDPPYATPLQPVLPSEPNDS